jgi:hypothetical protein
MEWRQTEREQGGKYPKKERKNGFWGERDKKKKQDYGADRRATNALDGF